MVKEKKDKKKKSILKRLVKKSQVTLHISNKEVPSILGDPNRFFKDELEEVKQTLFFK